MTRRREIPVRFVENDANNQEFNNFVNSQTRNEIPREWEVADDRIYNTSDVEIIDSKIFTKTSAKIAGVAIVTLGIIGLVSYFFFRPESIDDKIIKEVNLKVINTQKLDSTIKTLDFYRQEIPKLESMKEGLEAKILQNNDTIEALILKKVNTK